MILRIDSKEIINRHIYLKGIYQIPYRCCYSKDIRNLWIEGRSMSVSHVALGTVRTMATLSTVGQANAVAAYLCKKYNILPKEVGQGHMEELQQLLLESDQYIVGKKYESKENLANRAAVRVSSVKSLSNYSQDQAGSLEYNMALSLPLEGEVHHIVFYGRSSEDTSLRCNIYETDKPENYNPCRKIFSGAVFVPKTEKIAEIIVPLELELKKGHYFIELEENRAIDLAMSNYSYTGAVTSIKQPNADCTLVDYATGLPKHFVWKAMQDCLCFDVSGDHAVFSAENLINGYTRPYQMSNIWHSAGKNGEWIKLQWDEKQTISKLMLYFDSNLNRFCRSADLYQELCITFLRCIKLF